MARTVNANAGATRARILENAFALFSAQGMSSTSIRDVAKSAGVTLASVHHYFGSKDELWGACIDQMHPRFSALGAELATHFDGSLSVNEVIERAVASGYRFARERPVAIRLLIRSSVESGTHSPAGRKLLLDFLELATHGRSRHLDKPPEELRLSLQSLLFLVARYAVHDADDLAEVAGVPRDQDSAAIERHLLACRSAPLRSSPDCLQKWCHEANAARRSSPCRRW